MARMAQRRTERRAQRSADRETRRQGRMAMKQMRKDYRMQKLQIKTPGRDERRLKIAELASQPLAEGLGAGVEAVGVGFGQKLAGGELSFKGDNARAEGLSARELMPEVDPSAIRTMGQREDETKKPNMLIIAVIAVVALMMFSKKGKK